MARLALRVLPLAMATLAAPSVARADPSLVLSVGGYGALLASNGFLQGGGGVEASLLRFADSMHRNGFFVGALTQVGGFGRNRAGTFYTLLGGELGFGGLGVEAGLYGQSGGGGYGPSLGVHLGAFLSLGVVYVTGGAHIPFAQGPAEGTLDPQGFVVVGFKVPLTLRGRSPYAGFFNFYSLGRGRPLRRDGEAVFAARAESPAWRDDDLPDLRDLDAVTRAALARAWRDDAFAEHASVAAFTRLSMQLLALGAPPSLLEATHRAAIDEVRHARRCFTLASAYGAQPEAPGPLNVDAMRGAPCDLASLARESLLDGCLGEGLAAEVARATRETARDPVVRQTLDAIADDERRHAELAWAVVAWCLDAGGASVAEALVDALRSIDEARVSEPLPPEVDARRWSACGRATPSQVETFHDASAREVAARVWTLPAMRERVTPRSRRMARARRRTWPETALAGCAVPR